MGYRLAINTIHSRNLQANHEGSSAPMGRYIDIDIVLFYMGLRDGAGWGANIQVDVDSTSSLPSHGGRLHL